MVTNIRVAILTPIYKAALTANETIAVKHSFAVLKSRDIFFICPSKLDTSFYRENFPQAQYSYFPDQCFSGRQAYSDLLTSLHFYENYLEYTHILIAQTDCVVFFDNLDYWAHSCFDYVGAPWVNVWIFQFPALGTALDGLKFYVNVGNGGLSLRNTRATIKVIKELGWIKSMYHETVEDAFFSLAGQVSSHFLIPNAIHAAQFSLECEPRKYFALTNKLPMGTHAWEKWDKVFWLEHFTQQGIHGIT
ncbi:DUF5672 domain-containing protein [Gammaproteobacteria bacterium]